MKNKFKVDYMRGVAYIECPILVDECGAYVVVDGLQLYLNDNNSEVV